MAMIIEARDAQGRVTFHRVGDAPLSVGRAVSNDIILDDPYAEAVHARIYTDETNRLVIADAGSVNGLRVGDVRVDGAVAVVGGSEIRLGRSVLRFRSVDEVLSPALLDDSAPRPSAAMPAALAANPGRWDLLGRLLASRRAQGWLVVLMLAASMLQMWLKNTEESGGMTIFAGALVLMLALLLWAAVWAAWTRGPERRFQLLKHLAVASAATLAMSLWGKGNEWLQFLFPDASSVTISYGAAMLLIFTWAVAAHLAVPGHWSRRSRWRGAFVASGVATSLLVIGALLSDDEFSDVPVFDKQLKYLPATMIPTITVTDLLAEASDVRARADQAAARLPEP
jgi:pSer/pThr/pTyr-binding forkhead associated (FHA) protein